MTHAHDSSIHLGTSAIHGAIVLPEQSRRRHLHVIGQTGTGKTTLILNLIAQGLAAGEGIGLLDPLGALAPAALACVPTKRAHELVYLDPTDLERPIGFNVLDRVPPDRRPTVADDVVSAFIHIWGETAIGDRSQQVLRNAIRALLDAPTATLLCIPRLLNDQVYRARILRTVRDPVVLTYWRDQFAKYKDDFRMQVTAPILNKLDAVLSAPAMRNIVGQPQSTIDLRRIMDEGRILIVNLNKGVFGEVNTHLLGAFLVTRLAQTAFARSDIPVTQRRLFFLYADEFQDFASAGFNRILSQARNYALALTLSHQYFGQLPQSLSDATLGNAASSISLRIGAEDAPLIARHLGLEPELDYAGLGVHETSPAQQLRSLPNFTAWARLLIDDSPSEPILIELPPPPQPINHRPHRLITNSRVRFGRPRRTVEQRIARFLTPTNP
jgi:hypothetical protein